MRELIRRTGLSIAEIEERTGVGASYLKLLSSERRTAGPDLAAKLAPFFAERAAELRATAPEVARRMIEDAAFLEAGAAQLAQVGDEDP